jgi:hypothetical protein
MAISKIPLFAASGGSFARRRAGPAVCTPTAGLSGHHQARLTLHAAESLAFCGLRLALHPLTCWGEQELAFE